VIHQAVQPGNLQGQLILELEWPPVPPPRVARVVIADRVGAPS
jgi:hypothetical protein